MNWGPEWAVGTRLMMLSDKQISATRSKEHGLGWAGQCTSQVRLRALPSESTGTISHINFQWSPAYSVQTQLREVEVWR
jgi:hypothetical protein